MTKQPVGRNATPAWTGPPFVTFRQIATDMPMSVGVPAGHGHGYKDEMAPLWAGVLGQDPLADYSSIVRTIEELVTPRQSVRADPPVGPHPPSPTT